MTDPNVITSVPAVAVLALVLRGLWPFWTHHAGKDELFFFCRGLGWIIGSFLARTLYWGTLRGTVIAMDPEWWRTWSGWISGPDWVNAIFNLGLCVGAYHVLRAFQAMIPEEERGRWPLFRAPFYPHGTCFKRLARWYVRVWPTGRE